MLLWTHFEVFRELAFIQVLAFQVILEMLLYPIYSEKSHSFFLIFSVHFLIKSMWVSIQLKIGIFSRFYKYSLLLSLLGFVD